MKALLALLKKLYGSKAIQKALGTRTNVITLPDRDTKRFLTQDLNIEAASDAAIDKAYKDIEKLIPEVPKMNDQEILNFTTNLRRMDNRLNPPSAEVVDIRTSKPVAGIEKLAAERGFPRGMEPDSPLGQLLQSSRKIDDEIAKAKSTEGNIPFTMVTPKGDVKGSGTADDIFNMLTNPTRPGGPLDPNTGIVRTAARQILRKRLDAGEIDIPDAVERDAIAKGYQGGVDPIEVFRKRFGEDALQDLTEIADELNRAGDFNEIDEILKRNKMFEVPPKTKYEPDPGGMTDEQLREVLKKGDVDPDDTGFKDGGRVHLATGSLPKGIRALVAYLNKKFGKGTVKTADEMDRPESAKTKQAIEDFEKRNPDPNRQMTQDELEDFYNEIPDGEIDAFQENFDGTIGSANRIRKELKDYQDEMYAQYKGGKLDPEPGDTSRARFEFLKKKMEEMEMSGDRKLMSPDEIEELIDLENRYEYVDLVDKAENSARKMTDEEIKRLKELNDMNYKGVLDATENKPKSALDYIEEGIDPAIKRLEELGATKLAMRFKLKQKYPGINEDLVTQIIEAPENVRAQMLADMDNAMELMKKGKGSEEVVDILKMEPRTKQAKGGVAYLMGL